MHNGPIVIAHDGSPSAEHAIEQAAELLRERPILIVTVWEPGAVFDALGTPWPDLAPLEIKTALEVSERMYEGVQSLAEHYAEHARTMGLNARGLAVVDDVSVGETILNVAEEQKAVAILLGAHGHRASRELFIGSTTREVMEHALCPVIVVRDPSGPPERNT